MSSDSYFIRNFWFGMSGGVTSDKMSEEKQGYTSKHSIYTHLKTHLKTHLTFGTFVLSHSFLLLLLLLHFLFLRLVTFVKSRVGGWVKSLTGLWILCPGLKLGMKVITAEQLSQEHVSYNLTSLVLRFVDQLRSLCILNS